MKITIADVKKNTYYTNCKECGVKMKKYTIKPNGSNFYEKKYCSTACYNSETKKKASVVGKCSNCGNKFTYVSPNRRRKYCSRECSDKNPVRKAKSLFLQSPSHIYPVVLNFTKRDIRNAL